MEKYHLHLLKNWLKGYNHYQTTAEVFLICMPRYYLEQDPLHSLKRTWQSCPGQFRALIVFVLMINRFNRDCRFFRPCRDYWVRQNLIFLSSVVIFSKSIFLEITVFRNYNKRYSITKNFDMPIILDEISNLYGSDHQNRPRNNRQMAIVELHIDYLNNLLNE